MNYFITGGLGFIGRNLIRRLLLDGVKNIVVFDNMSAASKSDLSGALSHESATKSAMEDGRIFIIEGDVKDGVALQEASQKMDCVIHLAANTGVAPSVENPMSDCISNVVGTLNALEACRHNNIARFVFASSGAPVGDNPPPIHEEMAPKPASPYGASKLAGEGYCSAYKRAFGIETVALRFGNVYGPRSAHKESVVAKFINLALLGKNWEIYGDGNQTRDFIYIDDLVSAIIAASSKEGIGGEIFQIATAKETTVFEMATTLAKSLEKHGVTVPQIVHSDMRTGDVLRNFSDTRKAKSTLGWSASTNLEEGLDQTVKWFVS